MIPSPDEIALIVSTAWKAKSDSTPRTLQSRAGLIGPSDLGFCRNKAALMGRGEPVGLPLHHPADIGTAIHHWLEDALRAAFPSWQIERRFTATFPCGAQIAGSADIAITEVERGAGHQDGRRVREDQAVRRLAESQDAAPRLRPRAIQEGLLDDSQTVYVGNIYVDRSGEEPLPYVVYEEFDHAFTDVVDQWITDVIYAIQHDEDASRDIPAPVCERICEFYSVCRGDLPIAEPQFITDEDTRNAVRMYVEGREMAARGKKMQDQAKTALVGVNGSDGEWTVRWTSKAGSEVPGYYRAPSESIDVRRAR